MRALTRAGRRRLVFAGTVSAMLLTAAPPAIAAPWSAPQTISGAHQVRWEAITEGPITGSVLRVPEGELGFTPGGSGLAVLGRTAGGFGLSRFSGSAGTFGSLVSSRLGGLEPSRMALFGREGVFLGGQANATGDPRDPLNRTTLLDAAVSRGSVKGQFAKRQVLAKGVIASGAGAAASVTALAANSAGDAAAVVSVPVLGRTRVTGFQSRVFTRRRGEPSFRRIANIGIQTVGRSPAALALNSAGDVLVAWDDRKSVRARLITSGRSVGAEQRLGQGGSPFFGERLVAAIDGTRRMVVAWMAQRVGEGNYAGAPGIVAVAYASPYSDFRPAQVVQRGLPQGDGRVIGAAAVRATLVRDRGVVAWTGYAGGRYVVRTVDVTAGRLGATRSLSQANADARLQGMAVGPRGGTVAVWSIAARVVAGGPEPGIYAAARAAGASSWSGIETIAATGQLPADALVSGDPVSGRAVVLWSDPLGNAPSPVPVRYSVRAAG